MPEQIKPDVWEGIQEMLAKRLPEEVGRATLQQLQRGAKALEEVERLEKALEVARGEIAKLARNQMDTEELARRRAALDERLQGLQLREEVLNVREQYTRQHLESIQELVAIVFRGPITQARIQQPQLPPLEATEEGA